MTLILKCTRRQGHSLDGERLDWRRKLGTRGLYKCNEMCGREPTGSNMSMVQVLLRKCWRGREDMRSGVRVEE